jgi:hypothetical protein
MSSIFPELELTVARGRYGIPFAASIRSVSEQVGNPQVFLFQQDFCFHNLEKS